MGKTTRVLAGTCRLFKLILSQSWLFLADQGSPLQSGGLAEIVSLLNMYKTRTELADHCILVLIVIQGTFCFFISWMRAWWELGLQSILAIDKKRQV